MLVKITLIQALILNDHWSCAVKNHLVYLTMTNSMGKKTHIYNKRLKMLLK